MTLTTVFILAILFFATLIRSTFGFGESLIAVPLLIHFLPIEVAVPLSVLLSITIAGIVIIQDRDHVHFNSAKWLIIFSILGIPIGLAILIYGNQHIIKSALGVFIILYSVYSLVWKENIQLKTDNMFYLFICGFFSGILGGAYGINGPPLVVYGNMRNWSAKHFRATLQAYFLPVSSIGMLGYLYNGLWVSSVTYYFLISIPAVIPAILLGRLLNRKLKDGAFFKYVYYGLIVIGLLLFIQ